MIDGPKLYDLVRELYPICRSITGNGVRETLRRLQTEIPLQIEEVPSGTQVFDWVVPREWNIRDAYIKDSSGKRVVDFQASNLHVMSYSVPVHRRMPLAELRGHLFTLPDRPDWIPYRTSYYNENWGFCLSQTQLNSLPDGEYEVAIDSSLEPGHLTYGELCVPGTTSEEILISCHVCHPSLCNDNLSGIAVAVALPMRFRLDRIGSATVSYLSQEPSARLPGSPETNFTSAALEMAWFCRAWETARLSLIRKAAAASRRSTAP